MCSVGEASGMSRLWLRVPASAFQVGPTVTVTCSEGKWNKQVACEPVDCGVPDQHHVYAASFSCLKGTTFGSKCSFQCRHPAQLKGMDEGPLGLVCPTSGSSPGSRTPRAGQGFLCPPAAAPPVECLYTAFQCSQGESRVCRSDPKMPSRAWQVFQEEEGRERGRKRW